jgi:HAD superfamily hydrolase (TIGR01549 family)
MKKILLFDWGNTIMVDFNLPGPMNEWDKVAWVCGAEFALKALKEYTCCIATNAGRSTAEDVKKGLARVGADKYFSHIFASRDILLEKPDPLFFMYISNFYKTDPLNCIMTGDNYEKDITGAKSAGMKTILLNLKGDKGPFPDADAVIKGMIELPAIINKL